MTLPEVLFNQNIFYTDIKSLLRGLNSLDGSSQSRIRAIRVDSNGYLFKAAGVYTLVKFCLVSSLDDRNSILSPDIKGLFYDDKDNSYNLLRHLSNDSKEVILLKENSDAKIFLESISKLILIRKDYTSYQDLHSACIDSYMINNGVIFLYHDADTSNSYIVNRTLVPNPESNYENFLLFTKLYSIKDTENLKDCNLLEVNRKDLTVKGGIQSSDLDLSQVVIPIIHIYKEQQ